MNKEQYKLVIKAIAWLRGWEALEEAKAVNDLLIDYELLKLEQDNKRDDG